MKKLKQTIKDEMGDKNVALFSKAMKIGRVVKRIVSWVLMAVLVLAVVTFLLTKSSGKTPSLFGYSLHRVISVSMEPTLEVGDIMLSKTISDPSEINVGDIVTFRGDGKYSNALVTHRDLVAPYKDSWGDTVIVTKGDANDTDDGEIPVSAVESKVLKKTVFLKYIYDFFFSPWGLVIIILLFILLIAERIVNIVRLASENLKAEEEEDESDEEKEQTDADEPDTSDESKASEEADKPESDEAEEPTESVEEDTLEEEEHPETQDEEEPSPDPTDPQDDPVADEPTEITKEADSE